VEVVGDGGLIIKGEMLFRNRSEAGRWLAERLQAYAHRPDVIVLALPRGGVPVGFELARSLEVPLDVFLVRKLGLPGQEELAMGAIASGGVRVLNDEVVGALGVPGSVIEDVARGEEQELRRREAAYRGSRPPPDLRGRVAILVDDGLATGSTMRAAVRAVRQMQPARVVVAVPVAAASTRDDIGAEVDEIVCEAPPEPFLAVGRWYEDFSQTTDDEVRDLLRRAESAVGQPARSPQPS
jgi:predicted phosphoribosyltransferase